MKVQPISRREFMKLAAAGASVALLAGCQAAAPVAESGAPSSEVTELRFV